MKTAIFKSTYGVVGGEAFYLCELLDLNLALWCVRLGDSYYRVHASPRLSAQQAADLVTAQSQPCLSS